MRRIALRIRPAPRGVGLSLELVPEGLLALGPDDELVVVDLDDPDPTSSSNEQHPAATGAIDPAAEFRHP